MGTLSEKLFEVGLISEKKFREKQAEEEFGREKQERFGISKAKDSGSFDCYGLKLCKTQREFKFAAKKILLRDPAKINEIIQLAHRFKGDKKFIWFFYQIRDGLKDLSADQRESFLDKAFRKAGWTLES